MTTLGCSQHVAFVQSKCSGQRLMELTEASQINYNRRLDDVSEATITIPLSGDASAPCCEDLRRIEPWCHQLTIVREGDGVVWTGPITRVVYGRDDVTIEAKDKIAWLQFRVNEFTLNFAGNGPPALGPFIPLTELAVEIITLAMAEDPADNTPCFMEDAQGRSLIIIPPGTDGNLSDGLPPNQARQFVFEAFSGPTAFDDLNQLADSGLDYTVINQNLILTGENLPIAAIGILTDEMILGDVHVIKDGTAMGNSFYVRYDGNDDPLYPIVYADDDPIGCQAQCDASCSCVCPPCGDTPVEPCVTVPCPALREIPDDELGCYGRLERLIDGISVVGLDTAQQVAQKYLDRGTPAPRLIEFPDGTRLSPDCPFGINEIIPGQRLDVALTSMCLPIFQSFKIRGMDVTDNGTEESISIDLLALNQIDT